MSCYAVLGPFYFGRAYEHPPHFTWSMTAAASTTAVGTGCIEQPKTDPGVETQIATWGGGGEIPVFLAYLGAWLPTLRYQDGSAGPLDTYWAQAEAQDIGVTEFPWTIVTTDPDSGNYHLKTTTMNGGGWNPIGLFPIGFKKCDHVARTYWDPYWITTRINPGQRLSVSARAKLGPGSGTCSLFGFVYFLDSTGHNIPDNRTVFDHGITSSYTTASGSQVAPDGAGYALVELTPGALSNDVPAGTQRDVYVDNVDVFVDQVSVNALAPVGVATTQQIGQYDLNVSFEGNYLKGYAGTYPIPHKSGPEVLELNCEES